MKNITGLRRGKGIRGSIFSIFAVAALIVSGFFVFNAALATVSNINISSPTAGDEWRGEQLIEWTADGVEDDTVFVYLSPTGTFPPATLIGEFPFNTDSVIWNTSGLTEASTYKILITDTEAQFSSGISAGSFTVDNTPPTTTSIDFNIDPDPVTDWYNISTDKPTITLTCTDSLSGCHSVSWSFDGVSFTEVLGDIATVLPADIPEGELTLYFFSRDEAVDKDGNHNEEVVQTESFKVDTIQPEVDSYTLNGEETNIFFNPNEGQTVDVFLEASEFVDWVTVRIQRVSDLDIRKDFHPSTDGETTTVNWDGSLSNGVLEDGEYEIVYNIEDIAGNQTDLLGGPALAPHLIFVDRIDPTIDSFDSPEADEVYKDSVPVTFEVFDDNDIVCSYQVNGNDPIEFACENGSETDTAINDSLNEGRNNITFIITDPAGNEATQGPISIVFDTDDTLTVDDDAPADFDNIPDALEQAIYGDTILVADGVYNGDIDIEIAGLTLQGSGFNGTTIIEVPDGEYGIRIAVGDYPTDVTIDGFRFEGDASNGIGVLIDDGPNVVDNIVVSNNGFFDLDFGVFLQSCCNDAELVIVTADELGGTVFEGMNETAVWLENGGDGVFTVENTSISDVDNSGIFIAGINEANILKVSSTSKCNTSSKIEVYEISAFYH